MRNCVARLRLLAILAALSAFVSPAHWANAEPPGDKIDFGRQIRPILSDTCYTCHGPDEATRDSELRFDTREAAFIQLDDGPAIVPGDAEASILYQRIASHDDDMRMPPVDSGRQLKPEQIELIKRWIDQGANWQEHWSYVPPARPAFPKVDKAAWSRTGIDPFILARLERESLAPSPEASKETLIRRLSLDLTGLPPTLEEVDDFLMDNSAGAYETAVDRLMASPRYGEHMSVAWLDAARYSDTNGYQQDRTRSMWPWRDWVIDAINNNMPYDQFSVEQLAGDLLLNASTKQVLASGFNRNHPLNGEGGRIAEESRVDYVVDRVETTATVWLGLTAGCSRCHDHKYDPMTRKEFYQLYAFFNHIDETGAVDLRNNASPVMTVLSAKEQATVDGIDAEIVRLQAERDITQPAGFDQARTAWEQSLLNATQDDIQYGPWKFIGSFRGANIRDTFNKQFPPEVDQDPSKDYEEQKWEVSEIKDGEIFLFDFPVNSSGYFYREIETTRAIDLELSLGSDDALKVWHNGDLLLNRFVIRGVGPDQDKLPIRLMPGKNTLLFKIANGGSKAGFYFRATAQDAPQDLLDAVALTPADRSAEQATAISQHFRHSSLLFSSWHEQIAKLRRDRAIIVQRDPVEVMVMRERDEPRETYILTIGQYDQQEKDKGLIQPGVPASLPPLADDAPRDRLGLANWLMDPANPLTARVTVNRAWQQFFGRGLVKTTEDFGSQGEPPTHPRLLDWLATELVRLDWDRKALHRLIVTSATYRQSSQITPEQYEIDPENELHGRGVRYRMSSFAIRDQALALSGMLVTTMGGPPVKPYQPLGIWDEFSLGKIKYKRDEGDALYRRSLYVFWRRSVGPTMFFDTANRQVCMVRPRLTNSPLHALTLLNDTTFAEAARAFAQRVMTEVEGTPEARLNHAFRMATARRASPQEQQTMQTAFATMLSHYQDHPEQANELGSVGEWPQNESLDVAEVAAYTNTMLMLLNLDETITRE